MNTGLVPICTRIFCRRTALSRRPGCRQRPPDACGKQGVCPRGDSGRRAKRRCHYRCRSNRTGQSGHMQKGFVSPSQAALELRRLRQSLLPTLFLQRHLRLEAPVSHRCPVWLSARHIRPGGDCLDWRAAGCFHGYPKAHAMVLGSLRGGGDAALAKLVRRGFFPAPGRSLHWSAGAASASGRFSERSRRFLSRAG